MLEECRDHAGGHVRPDHLPVVVDADLLVREDVMQLDFVVVAAEYFGDAHDLAGTVAQARLLNDQVHRRADLFANRS